MIQAWARLRGAPQPRRVEIDQNSWRVRLDERELTAAGAPWDVPTTGDVYGVAFNYQGALERLGAAVNEPPYMAPPKAPVLYVKPANTWIGSGMPIVQPAEVEALRVAGALGIVIGRSASRVSEAQALEVIGGYTVVNDVSVPHGDYYRPAIREQCRDSFCPIGPWVVPARQVAAPESFVVRTFVNGELRAERRMSELVRPIARLIADVSAFMTLAEGDVLLPATAEDAPFARAGERVAIEIAGIGRLENPIVSERDALEGAQQ